MSDERKYGGLTAAQIRASLGDSDHITRALLNRIDELERERDEARAQLKQQWDRLCRVLSDSLGYQILASLEDGQISKRKAAEALGQALSGNTPEFAPATEEWGDVILADELRAARTQRDKALAHAARLRAALEDVLTTGNSDDFDWSGENTKASLLAACSAALAATPEIEAEGK